MTRILKVLQLRARSVFRRRSVERELQRELQAHVDQQIDEYIAAGMSPDDARHAALREFGGVSRFTDDVRDTWQVNAVDDLRRDLRYTWRGLRRRPLLVAVSVLSIGLGVCVNATIFAQQSGTAPTLQVNKTQNQGTLADLSPLEGAVLVGELRGTPVAALALGDGRTISDPYVPTAHLLATMRVRAEGLLALERMPSLRERMIAGLPAGYRTRPARDAA